MKSNWHQRFFQTTRGQILSLLRSAGRTVGELSETLGLTHNAIRVQLTALERDGLIQQQGSRRGTRKPHLVYEITNDAETLFPKAYSPILSKLLAVLSARLPSSQLELILDEVGHKLAETHFPEKAVDTDQRVKDVLAFLISVGAEADVVQEGSTVFVRGKTCPIADTVREHPSACRSMVSFLKGATGREVLEHCHKGARPACSFEIRLAATLPA
jgi:predicted ArsR family transcriptional regulator